jgi:hypothetical protein
MSERDAYNAVQSVFKARNLREEQKNQHKVDSAPTRRKKTQKQRTQTMRGRKKHGTKL